MAHKSVQLIIGRILTDEELRGKFLSGPADTLAALRDDVGLELTNGEIDALARTDPQLWDCGPGWIDARLQRCHLAARGPSERERHR